MLPTRQLTNAADGAVDGAQTRAVTLAPDHALVIRRRDLATPLNQPAVGIEQKLSVVHGVAVTLVNADGDDHLRLSARIADGMGRGRWDRHGLIEQFHVLASANDLVGGLKKRKIRIVRHHGLTEGRELHPLLAKLVDLAHDLFDGSLTAIEDRTQLNRGGFTNSHCHLPISIGLRTRWRRRSRPWGCR